MTLEEINNLKPGDKVVVCNNPSSQAAYNGSIAIFNKISNDIIFSKENPGIDVTWITQINTDGIEEKITQSNGEYWAKYFKKLETEFIEIY